ncbi:hypothetical protein C0068_12610 [Zhongshania marina]|uniref:Uncharacterized protein n=1 Tax=Zhongshania marina TaxID=2304603 RepID=A0A2S4HEL3_9GAMM|nr:hypothetical protein C0068_12610 [Marortus luteolus]
MFSLIIANSKIRIEIIVDLINAKLTPQIARPSHKLFDVVSARYQQLPCQKYFSFKYMNLDYWTELIDYCRGQTVGIWQQCHKN